MSPQRRNGDFSACWDEREAAFGGVCRWPLVVFGSTRPKTNQKKIPGASGLVFLSLTSGLVFLTFLFWLGPQRELRCRDLRDTRSPNPLSFLWSQHGNAPNGRRQFLPSALARCRSRVDHSLFGFPSEHLIETLSAPHQYANAARWLAARTRRHGCCSRRALHRPRLRAAALSSIPTWPGEATDCVRAFQCDPHSSLEP